jgi:hypothetical protein
VRAGTSKDHEVGGKGNIHTFDAFIRRKYQDPLEQKYFTLLNMANGTFKTLSGRVVNPRQFGTNDEIEAMSKELAIEDVAWLKESGTISGPPIPGHKQHAQGIPFRDAKKYPDSKQIVHLPHFDHEITKVGDDGRESKETVSMPYVRPARYFRSIGVVPEDFETEEDENGKPRIIIDANGKPKISEEARKRAVGYQKDYIPVHPDEFEGLRSATRNKGVYSGGSLDVNKNTSGLNTLDYGHHDYGRLSDQVFGPDDPTESRPETAMQMFSIDGRGRTIRKKGSTGEFYQDVIAGIRKCLQGTCGGATAWERSIATNNIEDFHQFIVQQMQHNLRVEIENIKNSMTDIQSFVESDVVIDLNDQPIIIDILSRITAIDDSIKESIVPEPTEDVENVVAENFPVYNPDVIEPYVEPEDPHSLPQPLSQPLSQPLPQPPQTFSETQLSPQFSQPQPTQEPQEQNPKTPRKRGKKITII